MATKPTDIERMHHMIEGIRKIFSYTSKLTYEEFMTNELIQDAVVKNFEVIGEAAYQITPELKTKYNHIEWSKIQGLRHILVHDYYKINPAILWNTKQDNLSDLLTFLGEIVAAEQS